MKKIKKRDYLRGINFTQNMPYPIVKKLTYQNGETVTQLSNQLRISYSITSVAVHLVNYFFHFNSYLNYDRRLFCAASLLLASKILEPPQKLKNVAAQYLKLIHE